MHRGLTCVAVVSLFVSMTAHADALDTKAPLHTGPTVDLGFSWGGQNLNRHDFSGDHVIGTYRAGEGVSGGVGMIELFGQGSGFGLKQELGVWVQYPLGDQDVTSVETCSSTPISTRLPSITGMTGRWEAVPPIRCMSRTRMEAGLY